MKHLQILLQNPWIRIALFLSFFVIFAILLIPLHGSSLTLYFAFLLVSSLCATFLVELPRKGAFFSSSGFHFDRFTWKYFYKSFLILHSEFAVILIIIAVAEGGLSISKSGLSELPGFLFMLFIAASWEEVMFRGVLLQSLSEKISQPVAAVVLSILFALTHGANPGIDFLSNINIFLAGLLFSFMYFHTRSLMLPIFFHFFWNVSELLILDSPISGINFHENLVIVNNGDKIYSNAIFGGVFGFESGLAATICLCLSFWLIWKFTTYSPYITSKLFKMKFEESRLVFVEKNSL